MQGLWWKVLAVLILLYVIVGGLITPLKPGITNISPSSCSSGEKIQIKVTGYNTHFASATSNRAWIKIDDDHVVKSSDIKTISDQQVSISFQIPYNLPVQDKVNPATIVFDNEIDGSFVQPNGIFIKSGENTETTIQWEKANFANLHQISSIRFPYRNILNETIRNTFFHVALWFAMFFLLLLGLWNAVTYLKTGMHLYDTKSAAYNTIAIIIGVLGILTGMVWAKFTWNTYWTNDVKLNMTAITLMIYIAYLILRGSISDQDKRAKVTSAYSIFAFIAMIPLLFVIPRMTDSLHPGNGGNPALGGEDLDNTLRMFFYPAIIGWTLLGMWIAELKIRYHNLHEMLYTKITEKNIQ